jgi:DNA-binding response OmpR family regulator
LVTVGALRIDPTRLRASLNGRELHLRPLDMRVLAQLADTPDRALSREALARALWGPDTEVDPRTVDSCVTRIRRALDGAADAIVTVRRVGYRIDPERLR